MIKLIEDLWNTPRFLVSDGYDDALQYISKIIPLNIIEIPTGEECWTWTVPEKWSVDEAWIEDTNGNRLLDLKDNLLHVLVYSLPIDKIVSKNELLEHLHSRSDRPNAIPFEFKYYEKDWGFCIEHKKLKNFTTDRYRVFINSKFEKGTLKIGDYTIPGKTDEIIVLVAHLCHPAMVNDDLSGVSVLVDLAKELSKKNNHYTYKCLFLPETIGSVAYLSHNENLIPKMKYGIFLEMLGNDNIIALQLSRQADTQIDKIAEYVLNNKHKKFTVDSFRKIIENDEFVFNGPGVDIPMISISRFPYDEYHTSDDNPSIIKEEKLLESKEILLNIIDILDRNFFPKRQFKGPVFLSKYNLWVDWRINKKLNQKMDEIMLNLEGNNSIIDIAKKLEMSFEEVYEYMEKFYMNDLIKKNFLG